MVMSSPSPLSLEGLADLQQRHVEATAARFQDVGRQMQETDRRMQETDRRMQETDRKIHSLTGQVEALVGLMREQGLRLTALAEQQTEDRREIRQILHRLEQQDGRLERQDAHLERHDRELQEFRRRAEEYDRRLDEHGAYIRRMLDLLERRGGNGGPERV
jgi:chromosome segregation ATPase